MIEALRKVIQRLHYPLEVILVLRARWYAAYPLSLRHIEEVTAERGVVVDHATVPRWAIKILPVLTAVFHPQKRPVGLSWRVDETYIKVAGQWKYLYRAVDRAGATIGFLLRAHRDLAAARRFFERAVELPRRSPSTRAVPTRRPSGACALAQTSSCASRSTSTTSSSRTTGPSRGSCGRCSGSNFRCASVLIAGI
jgi:transposase-like protein